MAEPGFAVVHITTTGVFPSAQNRVLEIAIVQLSPQGRVQHRWSSALNATAESHSAPSPTLYTADGRQAPRFADITSHLAQLLSGRALIAHNASFVVPFVMAEFTRAQMTSSAEPVSWCTMQLALDLFPTAGRSLQQCVRAAGLRPSALTTAETVADATARLLGSCIEAVAEPEFWNHGLDAAMELTWRSATGVPTHQPTPAPLRPQELRSITGVVNRSTPFLVGVVERMPRYTGPREHLDYLELIDRTLQAGDCSTAAGENLVRAAEQLGIGRFLCESINRDYFAQLVDCIDDSAAVSHSNMTDLMAVGHVLDLPSSVISATLQSLSGDAEPTLGRRLAG